MYCDPTAPDHDDDYGYGGYNSKYNKYNEYNQYNNYNNYTNGYNNTYYDYYSPPSGQVRAGYCYLEGTTDFPVGQNPRGANINTATINWNW